MKRSRTQSLGVWASGPNTQTLHVSAEQFIGRTFCAVVGGLGDPPCRCPPVTVS